MEICQWNSNLDSNQNFRYKQGMLYHRLIVRVVMLSIIWAILMPIVGSSQEPISMKQIQADFKEAKNHLDGFQNDMAIEILEKLESQMSTINEQNSILGLRIQMRHAEALEKDDRDDLAIIKLLKVVELSEDIEASDIYINGQLSLARLYEKTDRVEKCKMNLDLAGKKIVKSKVDSLYPRYAIRMSSYHRLFMDVDSAKYFAAEVLRTAPKYNQFEHNAVGHLLSGLLYFEESFPVARNHFINAGKTWKANGDYSGFSGIQSNLTSLHLLYGELDKALVYSDSTLMAIQLAEEMGVESQNMYGYAYLERSEIYEALKQLDSALYYSNLGHELKQEFLHKSNLQNVVEIESKYLDEQKAEKIKEQSIALAYEKERRNWLLAFISMVIVFTTVLSFYYIKLRKSNFRTKSQAAVLKKVNVELNESLEQQITLRGELHHRVKNNLQVILSLMDLQLDEITDPLAVENIKSLSERLYSMAAIHEMLYLSNDVEKVDLHAYVEKLCSHFKSLLHNEENYNYTINIEKQNFNLETLSPIGIIISELLMNSIKHARIPDKKLQVTINHEKTKEGHLLVYKDNGPGFDPDSGNNDTGRLGSYLLKSMSRQLNGRLETSSDEGAISKIYFKQKKIN